MNDSKFKYIDHDISKNKIVKNYNWENLYEHAHSELSLQQTKRDQIISLYLAIFTFLVPFVISIDNLAMNFKGLIFIGVGIVGLILAPVIVRYRTYKEIYWIACQTLTQLMNYECREVDKALVQHLFYKCLKKRSSATLPKNSKGEYSNLLFFKKNIFSSETLSYLLLVFLVCVITSIGTFFFVANTIIGLAVACGVFVLLTILLLSNYFKSLKEVYMAVIDGTDNSFNKTFSKAWFLHFYLDDESEEFFKKMTFK